MSFIHPALFLATYTATIDNFDVFDITYTNIMLSSSKITHIYKTYHPVYPKANNIQSKPKTITLFDSSVQKSPKEYIDMYSSPPNQFIYGSNAITLDDILIIHHFNRRS